MCLLTAIEFAPRLVTGAAVPLPATVLCFLVLLSTRSLAPDQPTGLGRRLWSQFSGQISSAALCLAAGRIIWDWPWTVFTFLPLWFGFTGLTLLRHLFWLPTVRRPLNVRMQLELAGRRLRGFLERRIAQGDDTAFSGALLVGLGSFIMGRLNPALELERADIAIPALLWLIVDRFPGPRWQTAVHANSRFSRFLTRWCAWLFLIGGLLLACLPDARLDHLAAMLFVAGILAGFGLSHRRRLVAGAENAARTLLGLGITVLGLPFTTHRLLGSQDALWYLNTLSDFLAQVRAGTFPVFVGQSEHLFNGGIMPVRFAPLFQHCGLLLDTLSLRTLEPAAVLNGVILSCLAGAGVSSLSVLTRLMPGRAWAPAGLTALFLTCPGVLAIVYHEDLFMTWTTLPWVPLVFGGCALTLKAPGDRPLLLVGGALGLVWWGHSPVALWSTLMVAIILVLWLVGNALRDWPWRGLLLSGGGFAAIAAYPLVSVLAFPAESGSVSLTSADSVTGRIAHFVRESFPGALVPLPFKERSLSDYQAGWGVLLLMMVGTVVTLREHPKRPAMLGMLAVCWGLLLLLLPVPSLNQALWSWLPGFLVNPTGLWPMQRLYLLIAVSSMCAVALLWTFTGHAATRRWFALSLALAVGWSAICSFHLVHPMELKRVDTARNRDIARPENHVLTRYAYLGFTQRPGYYSHGHVDPHYEQRLLSPDDGSCIGGNPTALLHDTKVAQSVQSGRLLASLPTPGAPWLITSSLHLEPGKRYVLDVRFNHPAQAGVLLIKGPGVSRVYALPEYGERLAFGSAPESSSLLSLFTTGDETVPLTLQFVPNQNGQSADFRDFGTYRWMEVDPVRLPIRVTGWIPYQAQVVTASDAWLETPRMFQPGYQAVVNGKNVAPFKSPEGLVAVPVSAGRNEVTLTYHPPLLLSAAFFTSLGAICVFLGGLLLLACRPWQPIEPEPARPPDN